MKKWKRLSGLLLAAVLAANSGCSSAKLKSAEATAAADAHAGLLLLAGAAHAAAQHPELLEEATQVGGALLQKEGVPPATAAKIQGALSTKNAQALGDAALEGAALTGAIAPSGQ